MAFSVLRRGVLHGAAAVILAASAGFFGGCGGDDTGSGGGGAGGAGGSGGQGGSTTAKPKAVRKSASALTAVESERFVRAFGYAVSKGYFDIFNDEHYDHERNRNHGGDVQATSPITVMDNPIEGG